MNLRCFQEPVYWREWLGSWVRVVGIRFCYLICHVVHLAYSGYFDSGQEYSRDPFSQLYMNVTS
jgi:hypothetical protein